MLAALPMPMQRLALHAPHHLHRCCLGEQQQGVPLVAALLSGAESFSLCGQLAGDSQGQCHLAPLLYCWHHRELE